MPARERFSIARALAALGADDAQRVRQRIDAVDRARAQRSTYRVRDDSRLVFMHCTDALDCNWDYEAVLHELMCIQWLHEHTPYRSVVEEAMREMAGSLKAQTGASWDHVWRAVSESGADLVKYACLDTTNKRFPVFQRPARCWADEVEDADATAAQAVPWPPAGRRRGM